MKFRLLYEGPIAPRRRASLADIHAIRLALAPQICELWRHSPLRTEAEKMLQEEYDIPTSKIGILETRGTTVFAPLVSKRLDLLCELEITFLRRQAPGQLIGDGGDIDNRIKTLLGALALPPPSQQKHFEQANSSHPIHCLLQDDSLVTKLSVETDRLLRPVGGEYDLVAIIGTKVTASRLTFTNMSLVN